MNEVKALFEYSQDSVSSYFYFSDYETMCLCYESSIWYGHERRWPSNAPTIRQRAGTVTGIPYAVVSITKSSEEVSDAGLSRRSACRERP